MIYETIIMDGDKETTYTSLMVAFRNRPASFFTQHVKSLSITGEIPFPLVIFAINTCQSIKHISLCQGFPYLFSDDDEDTYFFCLLSKRPEFLRIDIDRHKQRHLLQYNINASLPFFSNLIQLDLLCQTMFSLFITPDLGCMRRLQRIRVLVYRPTDNATWLDGLIPFADMLMRFLPSSQLEYCVLFFKGYLPPFAKWITQQRVIPLVDGTLHTKLLFGMDVDREEDYEFLEEDNRGLMEELCWMGPSLPKDVTVWDRAGQIMKRREESI